MASLNLVRKTQHWLISLALVSVAGCSQTGTGRCTAKVSPGASAWQTDEGASQFDTGPHVAGSHGIQLVNHEEPELEGETYPLLFGGGHTGAVPNADELSTADSAVPESTLQELVSLAVASNPRLRELEQETEAAWAQVPQVRALPDPAVGTNVFIHPIETMVGGQRASFSVMQMIPWLKRLDAQGQQAAYEALALHQIWQAERLQVAADVKAGYHRLYVLRHRLDINEATQPILESLLDVATARVGVGEATQGDVLLASLELSRLAEERLTLEQQLASAKADLNRLLNQPADAPLPVPDRLEVERPPWRFEELRELALEYQPEIAAARLRTQATRWGLQVAALRRRPDIELRMNWFVMDDNRPPSEIVTVGRDAWSVGAEVSLPLWREKYDAAETEAARRHFASHAATDAVIRRYESRLLDLLEQARAAEETATLYESTLLPQARQTLEADRQAYGQGLVEFDRVIADVRSLLTLEAEYHRAIGRWATAVARLKQAAGIAGETAPIPADMPSADSVPTETAP